MLYEKQVEILKEIKSKYMLPLGTSTGKTMISLFYYFMKYNGKKLIIITPAAKVKEGGWDREIKKVATYLKLDVPNYEVISYNKALNYKFEKAFYILDEAHYIKSTTSQRSKILRKVLMKEAIDFLFLTATAGTKIEEYINYFIIWGFVKTKTEFLKKYTIQSKVRYGTLQFLKITGYINENEFKTLLKSKSTNKLTVDDIAELHNRIYKEINFKSSTEYKSMKKTRMYNGVALDTQMKLCSYLRMFANTKDKIEMLKYIVETSRENNDNLAIFYNFNKEKEEIIKAINIDYLIDGSTKQFPKKEEFNKQRGTVTLVQIRAGGTGIELTYCNKILYYSPTYSYQDYEQSLGRAYRLGQEKKVIIYKFNTEKTIEEDIWKCLEVKQDFNEKIWEETNE